MRQSRTKKVPFLVRFRGLLLLATVVSLVLFIGLYLFGRSGAPSAGRGGDAGPPVTTTRTGAGMTTRSEGFDYTHFNEGKALFRVRGKTQSVDRQDNAHLEGVQIELFRSEDQTFHAESEWALYQQKNNSAELNGNVHLEGPQGFELWTDKLTVASQGRRIISPVPVRFRYGQGLEGSSNRLRVEVPARLFLLQGDVLFHTSQAAEFPASLRADRGFFEEQRRLLRAEGDVKLHYRKDQLQAQRLSAYLADDRDTLRFIRAKWKVSGRLTVPATGLGASGEDKVLNVAAESLSLLLDPQGKELRKVELEGSERQSAQMATRDDAAGTRQRITANYMEGDFRDNVLGDVRAFGQVHISETAAGGGPILREAHAERAQGTLGDAGALRQFELLGSVEYREGSLRMRSDQGDLDLAAGRARFQGKPARLETEQGEVTAPTLVYQRDSGLLLATGGVHATLQQGAQASVPGPLLASGSGPIFVDAENARWLRAQDVLVFQRSVRAWRGNDLILADELRMDRGGQKIQGQGKVKTVWHPQRAAPSAPTSALAGDVLAGNVLEINADQFAYDSLGRTLTYEGQVQVLDGPRTMGCGQVRVELDSNQELQELECLTKVRLQDRSQGRAVEGERAVYDPRKGMIQVWGEPVKMTDRRGSEVQGRHLVYLLENGSVEFLKAPEGAAAAAAGKPAPGPAKTGPPKAGPPKAGPLKTGPPKAGPSKAGSLKAGPLKTGPLKTVPSKPPAEKGAP